MMRKINKPAARSIDFLLYDLPEEMGASKVIDYIHTVHMPIHVSLLADGPQEGTDIVSVSQQGEQNGDVMYDPEISFLRDHRGKKTVYYPVSYRNDFLGINQHYLQTTDEGKLVFVDIKDQKDCAVFVGKWMKNLRSTHGIL